MHTSRVELPKRHLVARRPSSPFIGAAVLMALFALVGCQDPMQPLPRIEPPIVIAAPPVIGELRGTVDLVSGILSFEPIRTPGASHLFSAQVYGNQGQTIRLYNNTVSVTISPTGRKQFSGDVGLQNLLPHSIGDEQGDAAAPDTMGIFMFFTELPVVTASSDGCSGCTITLPGTHGTASFTAPNQHYFFWPELVGAYGSGSDTTRSRFRLTFDADPRVLNFSFRVLIYAAWPAPHSNRWRVEYRGDTIPDDAGTKPRWRTAGLGGTWSASGGLLTTDVTRDRERLFFRRDSLAREQSAYIEARARPTRGNQFSRNTIGLADGTKLIGIGFGANAVGWVDAAGSFLSSTACACGQNPRSISTAGFRSYTVQKFGADSAVFLVDGVRESMILYSRMDTDPYTAGEMRSPLTFFGMTADNRAYGGTSEWETVRYELGAATP